MKKHPALFLAHDTLHALRIIRDVEQRGVVARLIEPSAYHAPDLSYIPPTWPLFPTIGVEV